MTSLVSAAEFEELLSESEIRENLRKGIEEHLRRFEGPLSAR